MTVLYGNSIRFEKINLKLRIILDFMSNFDFLYS